MNKDFANRMNRLEGQLKKLKHNIEADASCDSVIPQFLAVKGAFNAAFEMYVKDAIEHCDKKDDATRDQLITMLIRK